MNQKRRAGYVLCAETSNKSRRERRGAHAEGANKDYLKTINCMQRTAGIKDNVNMPHHMESQTHVDAICISMRSRRGIYVDNALFEALLTTISNTLQSILQAKWMLNVKIFMPLAARVRLVPFVVVVAKCNYQFSWIPQNRGNRCFPMKLPRQGNSGETFASTIQL